MKLYSLLKNIKCRIFGTTILNISGLYHKDTEVKENGLFFCLRGTRVDGTEFVKSAVKNGAVAVVTEQEIQGLSFVTQIVVKNARETMSLIACRFYGSPAEKLKLIGVTGTNGKTTVSTLIFSSLKSFGKNCAVIGTNGIIIQNQIFESGMTTPDPIILQKYLSLMVRKKVEYVVMEVSAHALDLCKIDGIVFEQVIFTNLTEDHLDYFKTMEKYFSAKQKLFSKKYAKLAIINIDDEYGKRLAGSINLPYFTYAINEKNANLVLTDSEQTKQGQKFCACFKTFDILKSEKVNSNFCLNNPETSNLNDIVLNDFESQNFEIKLFGKFNLYNYLAVILSLKNLGYSLSEIAGVSKFIQPVDGRFNTYFVGEKMVVIDYAHTPDGLLNILNSCREIAKSKKLIAVFGCGGNRETGKRKIMGEISSKIADFSIITTDNPRFEKKEEIAREIESGFLNKNYEIVLDRAKAIERALVLADDGDVICIAGKGAENYIEENGIKIPYSDRAIIEKLILNGK